MLQYHSIKGEFPMDEINFYLVIQKRPGEYIYIDINSLDISDGTVQKDLKSIDYFTSKYSLQELRDSVIRSNMVDLDGELRIVSDARRRHNLPVYTRDIYNDLFPIVTGVNEMDHVLKGRIHDAFYNVVKNIFDDEGFIKNILKRFKEALDNNCINEVFNLINELPYDKARNIYFVIYRVISNRKNNINESQKLQRLNNAA